MPGLLAWNDEEAVCMGEGRRGRVVGNEGRKVKGPEVPGLADPAFRGE